MRREELFARDACRCVYCGLVFPPEELTVDHVQPRVRGGDGSPGNLVTACGGCNTRKGHRRVAEFLADEPAAYVNFRRYARHVWVNPQARGLLETLGARGLGRAVVTNTVSPLAATLLRAANLTDCFESVACADLVARSKPAPDLVLYALEKLGVAASEALMVGDSRYDRGAAGAAGVRFVGLGLDGDARIEQLSELLPHLTLPR